MDRTAWIAVILCSLGMVGLMYYQSTRPAPPAPPAPVEAVAVNLPDDVDAVNAIDVDGPDGDKPGSIEIKETVIATSKVEFHLSNDGAGIQFANLTDQAEKLGDTDEFVTKNRFASHPIGALSTGPNQFENIEWSIVRESPSEVVYKGTTSDQLEVTKRFSLPLGEGVDPHLLRFDIAFSNTGGSTVELGNRYVYLGASGPDTSGEWPAQGGTFWKSQDGKMKFKDSNYGKKGWLAEAKPYGIFEVPALEWAGSNNQFFATVLIPTKPQDASLWTDRFPVKVPGFEDESIKKKLHAVESAVGFPPQALSPGDQVTLSYGIFTGPKEYRVLKEIGGEAATIQDIMNYDQIPVFGWLFGWIIKPVAGFLIWLMISMHELIGSWGLAIIAMTVVIRIIMWPLYAKSARSMKRMSKLAPKMKDLKEKYADDPQKMNQETMAMYREYGVNPLGGCLPMLVQMPIFLSFYRMLWSAVELRHESFLWIDDLSMPDTFATVMGFPINLLPILMAITTFIQMQMTPKTGDSTQRMIFMFMPVVFLVICYNFASALALYWTTSNLWTIGQTWLMKKMPEPELKKASAQSDKPAKKGFFEKLQDKAEELQQKQMEAQGVKPAPKKANPQQQAAPQGDPKSRTKLPSEKGERHSKSKRKKKK